MAVELINIAFMAGWLAAKHLQLSFLVFRRHTAIRLTEDATRMITTMAATRMPAMPSGGRGLFPGKSGDASIVVDDASMLLGEVADEVDTISLGELEDTVIVDNTSRGLVLARLPVEKVAPEQMPIFEKHILCMTYQNRYKRAYAILNLDIAHTCVRG